MIPELHNWFTRKDPFRAPEVGGVTVAGDVYGHSKFPNGHKIQTSQPVHYDPVTRLLTTYSGSVYKLGEPDGEWLKWMREKGIEFDSADPFKGLV